MIRHLITKFETIKNSIHARDDKSMLITFNMKQIVL